MKVALPAIRVQYDGMDATHHILELRELSLSLNGLSRLFNSSVYLVSHGEIPPSRFKPPARFYARKIQDGCFPIEIVPYLEGNELKFLSEAIAALGTEIIQRLATIAILLPSGRAKEVDPHYRALMELTKKIHDDGYAMQEMQLAERAKSEERLIELVKELARNNQSAVVDTVHPVGRTCTSAKLGDIETGGIEVDLPTAQTIRAEGELEVGDIQKYTVEVDGVIAHNRTCKLYVEGEDDRVIAGDLVDPVADNWPNIYQENIKRKKLEITAKPTLKDGKIHRLAVFDARRIDE